MISHQRAIELADPEDEEYIVHYAMVKDMFNDGFIDTAGALGGALSVAYALGRLRGRKDREEE